MTPREHMAAALDFLDLANSPMAQRNRLLRSELLWCAAAHAVKTVANRRGWQNRSHDDLFDVAGRLAGSVDVRIEGWFRQANRLHRNMYEGDMGEREITIAQGQVRRLVNRLADVAADTPTEKREE